MGGQKLSKRAATARAIALSLNFSAESLPREEK